MKVPIEIVAAAMKQEGIAPEIVIKVVEALNEEASETTERKKPIKKQFVVVLYDKDGKVPKEDFTASIVQIPEEDSPASTLERIYRTAYDFNCTRRGRTLPYVSVGETLQNASSQGAALHELWIRTKTPVLVVKCDNTIPKAPAE